MRVCHGVTAVFDDPNLVSCAGLAPVLELAERAGLHELIAEHVQIDKPGGGNAVRKVLALVAGMIAGADSIDDCRPSRNSLAWPSSNSLVARGVRSTGSWLGWPGVVG